MLQQERWGFVSRWREARVAGGAQLAPGKLREEVSSSDDEAGEEEKYSSESD